MPFKVSNYTYQLYVDLLFVALVPPISEKEEQDTIRRCINQVRKHDTVYICSGRWFWLGL